MVKHQIGFPYSDTLLGKIITFDPISRKGTLNTEIGEHPFELSLSCTAELIRNLDEPYADCTDKMSTFLEPQRSLFVEGIFYPTKPGSLFEVHHIIFLGSQLKDLRYREEGWWVKQVDSIAKFYLEAQFEGGSIEYNKFRTLLSLSGSKHAGSNRQETNSFSRLIGGFATAYLLTGKDRYLECAEKGVEYLTDHMRFYDQDEELVYWYHAIDLIPGTKQENKIFASEYGDDYYAIAACEQIYALGGLTQTYRITGNPDILKNIRLTIKLFETYFSDKKRGGYFSHLDPLTLNPKAPSLGINAAKKNWNSIGDHLPVYLINLWCTTGEAHDARMVEQICDLIVKYFAPSEGTFVYERFFEDWSLDFTYLWQKEAAVVGHNLKIAWVLLRAYGLLQKPEYAACAKNILKRMSTVGRDALRGGWYDVLERSLRPGETWHRFVFHDRKAWWQQEQAILAYRLASILFKDESHSSVADQSSAFYNAFFLDHQDGGTFSNVQANGIPYLMGTERYKGSRWMSACHSIELAYYAAIYDDLLQYGRPLDLFFKPNPKGVKDHTLFVGPDIFLPGSISIESVWIEGKPYKNYESDKLSIHLPDSSSALHVKVRLKKGV